MPEINPLKLCNDMNSFNEFTKKLTIDAKSGGHRYIYKGEDGTSRTYTINQIAYRLNKCRKLDESSRTISHKDDFYEQDRSLRELKQHVKLSLDFINQDNRDRQVSQSTKTKVKDAWFSLTHKGFDRNEALHNMNEFVIRSTTMESKLRSFNRIISRIPPSYEVLKDVLQREKDLDLDKILKDPAMVKVLFENNIIRSILVKHAKANKDELSSILDTHLEFLCNKKVKEQRFNDIPDLKKFFKAEGRSLEEVLKKPDLAKLLTDPQTLPWSLRNKIEDMIAKSK